MDPKITNSVETDNVLSFTIENVDVSFVNAIRRTLLSDIDIAVFKTMPYEENKANILLNTTRLNNEILKQRLSCIPIHIANPKEYPLQNYLLEVDEENKTDVMMYVTTEHFKIRNIITGDYVDEKSLREIFPPFEPDTGNGKYFIDFVRLRPKISDQIPGEKIKFTCEFSIANAKGDSMFNVTNTCAYGFTPDVEKISEEAAKLEQKWKDEGKATDEIAFDVKNWKLLDGLRYVIKHSFDFLLETNGIYENETLIVLACDVLLARLDKLGEHKNIKIIASKNTMPNCFDVILENEDYTLGNVLSYLLYSSFFEDKKILTYCGFKKLHPHDTDSIIRVAFSASTSDNEVVSQLFMEVIEIAKEVFRKIKKAFIK